MSDKKISLRELRERLPWDITLRERDALVEAVEVLKRLASTETFTTALDLAHAKPEALAAELRARGQYASDAISRFCDFKDAP